MISKRIQPRTACGSKAMNIGETAKYVLGLNLDEEKSTEKVTYWGSVNCDVISRESRELLVKEMVSLAMEKPKSVNPCEHFVQSWKITEKPTPKQTDEAVRITLSQLKMSDCKTIYGMHEDTENVHLHIYINRVNPKTKIIQKLGLWKMECAKALAAIEHTQGWTPEKRAMFKVLENGTLGIRNVVNGKIDYISTGELAKIPRQGKPTDARDSKAVALESGFDKAIAAASSWEEAQANLDKVGGTLHTKGSGAVILVRETGELIKASDVGKSCSGTALEKRFGCKAPDEYNLVKEPRQNKPRKSQAAADMEAHRGEKSSEAIALESGFDKAIAAANSWEGAQANLNKIGGTLYTKGSGAVILVRETGKHIKASSLGRACSGTALEKRFGRKAPDEYNVLHRPEGETKAPDAKSKPAKQEQPTGLMPSQIPNRNEWQEEHGKLMNERGEQRKALLEKQRAEREEIRKASKEQQKGMADPQRSRAAFKEAVELRDLKDRHKKQRLDFDAGFRERAKELDERLRPTPSKKTTIPTLAPSVPLSWQSAKPPENLQDIKELRPYEAVQKGNTVHYFRRQSPIKDDLAFVDKGNKIVLTRKPLEDKDILAALRLGQINWGNNQISRGPQEYIDRAVAIALKNDIVLANPEWHEGKAKNKAAAKAALEAQKEAERIAKAQKEAAKQQPKTPMPPQPEPPVQPTPPAPEADPTLPMLDKEAIDRIVKVEIPAILSAPNASQLTKEDIANKIGEVLLPYGRGGNDPDNPKGLLALQEKKLDRLSAKIYKAIENRIGAKTIKDKIIIKIVRKYNTPEMIARVIEREAEKAAKTQASHIFDEAARDRILMYASVISQDPGAKDNQDIAQKLANALRPYGSCGNDPGNPKGLLALPEKDLNILSFDISKATGKRIDAKTIKDVIISKIVENNNTPEMIAEVKERRKGHEPPSQSQSQSH